MYMKILTSMTEEQKLYFRNYYAKNRVRLLTNRGTYGKPKGKPKLPLSDRFWPKVKKTETCWLWLGPKNQNGYGRFSLAPDTNVQAHRWAYEDAHGPIPATMQIDHLCRVRACVNPEHMEIVSPRENTLRGKTIPAMNSAKTHCLNGHEFTPENTYHPPRRPTNRHCRACIRHQNVERYQRRINRQ